MSELKDTLYGKPENAALGTAEDTMFGTSENMPFGTADGNIAEEYGEINGQVTLTDTYEPVSLEGLEDDDVQTVTESPEELIRESMNAVERMKLEIAEENEKLDRRFAENIARPEAAKEKKRRPTYVIGVISAAASLIFMGTMLWFTASSSPIGPYAAIKASPVMLIFLGAEIIFAMFKRKTLRLKIDIRSVVVIAVLIAVSSALTLISVNASAGNKERIYAEQRIQNMLASRLHDTIARDYIRSVDIETQLFGEDAEMYETPADLTDGDIINLTVYFSDAQMTIRDFAKDCHEVLTDLGDLSYNFGHIDFIADDKVNHYELEVDWHYQADYSADRLAGLVGFFGDNITDHDIPDIVDDEDYE